ncbi:MAG: hypothetical protein PHC34_07985 [Candidatus Gastranaerophilales bacterium]|nr:hypothetical protein [Candidatus Gastranaerophilales bacterium]
MNICINNNLYLKREIGSKISQKPNTKQFSNVQHNRDIFFTSTKPDIKVIKNRFIIEGQYLYDHSLKEVYTEKLNNLLKLDPYFYVGIGGKYGIKSKYQNFIKYLETDKSILAPILSLYNNKAGLIDERHTFAVLRDIGMKKIPLAVKDIDIPIVKKLNLID